MPDLPPESKHIVLAVLEARVKEAKATARPAIEHLYADGTRTTTPSPLASTKLGPVYRTEPDPMWEETDCDAHCKALEADPDNVEYVDDIARTDEQVIALLAEHAPELLGRIERDMASAVNAAVVAAARGEEPLPGIERVKARGSLVVRPGRNAGQAVGRLVQAGAITWDGCPLCSGQAADESELRGYRPRPRERSAAA
jgi:hypothetical protein